MVRTLRMGARWPLALVILALSAFQASCRGEGAGKGAPSSGSPIPRVSGAPAAAQPAGGYDIVIRGGRVLDPETGFDGIADVGVLGDAIAAISPAGGLKGKVLVEAGGMAVAPGFIDVDIPLYPTSANYRGTEYWKLTDGVTSALWLHNGYGDVDVILRAVGAKTHAVNWAFGVRFTDYQEWYKTRDERIAALRRNIQKGGLWVAGSPEYYPGVSTDDMVAYAKVAAEFKMPVGLHLRYSRKDSELKGVAEAIEVAERSGAHVHIFHLPSTGGTFNMPKALSMLEDARARGVRIDADAYPYTYWMTFLNSARFDPGWREGFGLDYKDLYYVPTKTFLDKASFDAYRKVGGLAVVPEGSIPLQDSLLRALAKDWIFLASDGGYDFLPGQAPAAGHPRDTGNFSHALALAREQGIPLMSMVRKMTLDPARLLALTCADFKLRGRLQEGAYADITVFDPATARDSGTAENPAQESAGIRAVIVNGELRWLEGKLIGKDSGRLMDRTGRQ
jgi:hypothetical protein